MPFGDKLRRLLTNKTKTSTQSQNTPDVETQNTSDNSGEPHDFDMGGEEYFARTRPYDPSHSRTFNYYMRHGDYNAKAGDEVEFLGRTVKVPSALELRPYGRIFSASIPEQFKIAFSLLTPEQKESVIFVAGWDIEKALKLSRENLRNKEKAEKKARKQGAIEESGEGMPEETNISGSEEAAESSHGGAGVRGTIREALRGSERTQEEIIAKFRQNADRTESRDTPSTFSTRADTENIPSIGALQNRELEMQQQMQEEESNTLSNVSGTQLGLLEEASRSTDKEIEIPNQQDGDKDFNIESPEERPDMILL